MPDPRPGSGTKLLTRSSTPARPGPRLPCVRGVLVVVRAALLPEVEEDNPRPGIVESRFRLVRFFRHPGSRSWIMHEP